MSRREPPKNEMKGRCGLRAYLDKNRPVPGRLIILAHTIINAVVAFDITIFVFIQPGTSAPRAVRHCEPRVTKMAAALFVVLRSRRYRFFAALGTFDQRPV